MTSTIASEIRKLARDRMDIRKKYQEIIKDIPYLWNRDKSIFLDSLLEQLQAVHGGKLTEDEFQRFCIQAYESQGIVKPEEARLLFHTHTANTTGAKQDMQIEDIEEYLIKHSNYAVDSIYEPLFKHY
jgi:hypothetical protein